MDITPFFGTAWALFPPIVAIILALLTKEVYSSLFIGILVGALMYSNFNPVGMVAEQTFALIARRLAAGVLGVKSIQKRKKLDFSPFPDGRSKSDPANITENG